MSVLFIAAERAHWNEFSALTNTDKESLQSFGKTSRLKQDNTQALWVLANCSLQQLRFLLARRKAEEPRVGSVKARRHRNEEAPFHGATRKRVGRWGADVAGERRVRRRAPLGRCGNAVGRWLSRVSAVVGRCVYAIGAVVVAQFLPGFRRAAIRGVLAHQPSVQLGDRITSHPSR